MIAIDWGTTSFRAYRLDREGNVVDSRSSGKGIMATPPGPNVLEEEIGAWLDDAPIVMSGMVGSRQGWVEAPYVPCPAGYREIAAALKPVTWGKRKAWIVPGVSSRDTAGVPDVMRGEETQILGCGVDGTICLPGTHSKWVEVRSGRIERFSTAMTGEVYAVLKQHSILGRMMEEGAADAEVFAQGVRRSGDEGGLLHHLFGVRTRGLLGELAPAASASYLSGILIGHELRARATREVLLLGAPALTALYAQAAALLGVGTRTLDAEAAVRCLFRLGRGLPPAA
jgi:2-dehydro-3-deoxygalactonokinase